jgi:hypothetical protein
VKVLLLLIASVPAFGAIAVDNRADLGASSTGTLTTAFTTAGANRIIFVGCETAADILTGITYAGTSLTRVDAETTVRALYLYALINPTIGANNVVVSSTPGTNIHCGALSYTGVSQSGQPYVHTNNTASGLASGASISVSLTTTTANDWMVASWTNNVSCSWNGTNGNPFIIDPGPFAISDIGPIASPGSTAFTAQVTGCGTYNAGVAIGAITAAAAGAGTVQRHRGNAGWH